MERKQVIELIKLQNIRCVEFYIDDMKLAKFPKGEEDVKGMTCDKVATLTKPMLDQHPQINKIHARFAAGNSIEKIFEWEVDPGTKTVSSGPEPEVPKPLNGEPMNRAEIKAEILDDLRREHENEKLKVEIDEMRKEMVDSRKPLNHIGYVISEVVQTVAKKQGWFTGMGGAPMSGGSDTQNAGATMQGDSPGRDYRDINRDMNQNAENKPDDSDIQEAEIIEDDSTTEQQNVDFINNALQNLYDLNMTPEEIFKLSNYLKANPSSLETLRNLIK